MRETTPEDEFDPSRSAKRREALDVLKLAKELAVLTGERLAGLEMPDDIREQILECQRIRSHIAHKRQLQFLAKVMRAHEEALPPLRAALHAEQDLKRLQSAEHKRIERWRKRLLAEGDEAFASFCDSVGQFDRQGLRQALKRASSAQTDEQRHGAERQVFRMVKQALEGDDQASDSD
jgi:ribosome-associated protein